MIKVILIFLSSLILIDAQNSCSNYWQYVRDQNTIQGLLSFAHEPGKSEHLIKIVLSLGAKLPNSYVGEISLKKESEAAYEDALNGHLVQYRVKFPLLAPLPKLEGVIYNNKLLCSGQKENAEYVTTITLHHMLFSKPREQSILNNHFNGISPNSITSQENRNSQYQTQKTTSSPQYYQNYERTQSTQSNGNYQTNNNVQYTQSNQVTNPPTTPATSVERTETTNKRQSTSSQYNQCGVRDPKFLKYTGLIINGRPAQKGEFPWLVSYFHNGGDINAFICGGTLVSSKAVLTAAHCIHEKRNQPRHHDEALFYLGKHNVKTFGDERDFIISAASKFIIHPEWDPLSMSFDADIAVVILTRTIHFTNSIRPICLWSGTSNYYDILDHYGLIAGYGKIRYTDPSSSDVPYWTAIPAVDDGTCLRSNDAFTRITSSRTFCIGKRDGKGPCNGDSGGGFFVKSGDRFYLRGIISASIIDVTLRACDTKNYGVCTDVAAFYPWIMQNI